VSAAKAPLAQKTTKRTSKPLHMTTSLQIELDRKNPFKIQKNVLHC